MGQEATVALAWRIRRRMQLLAGTLALAFSACSSVRNTSAERLPPPSFLGARATSANPGVPAIQQASAQVKVDDKPKSGFALPAPPAASTQGKPLPIDLPTALALTSANPLDIQIAGERLKAAGALFDRARVLWLPNI